jgi:hypothetical protein
MFKIEKQIFDGFYLPHIEYEGSIGLVSRKLKKMLADFHFSGLFMNNYHDLSDNCFSICHAPLPLLLLLPQLRIKFGSRLQPSS